MLVIDDKYNIEDGRIIMCIDGQTGTTLKKTRAAKAKLKIQEFAEEKEDRDPQPQDLIQISRKNEGR